MDSIREAAFWTLVGAVVAVWLVCVAIGATVLVLALVAM